jgi:hypothetical protein
MTSLALSELVLLYLAESGTKGSVERQVTAAGDERVIVHTDGRSFRAVVTAEGEIRLVPLRRWARKKGED